MLQRYHDGDLSDAESAQVESGLAAHPDAQLDLDELELIGDVLRESSAALEDDYDPARIWSGLQGQLEAEAAPASAAPAPSSDDAATSGLLDGLIQWLTPPRLLPIGALAAAAVAWMVISTPSPVPTPTGPAPGAAPTAPVAKPSPPKPPRTAVAVAVAPAAPAAQEPVDNEVIVDSVETEDAEVLIGATAGEEPATVIWLFADSSMETE